MSFKWGGQAFEGPAPLRMIGNAADLLQQFRLANELFRQERTGLKQLHDVVRQ